MNDLKRVSLVAVVFLVLLRMSIGWQFLYEGLWKYDTLGTARPWSSEGYLKNAQGPFREHFRAMSEDPDDLNWLDFDTMSRKWDAWRDRFVMHYGLSEKQIADLDALLDGKPEHVVAFDEVPAAARDALQKFENAREGPRYDPATQRLSAPGNAPLLPTEAAALLTAVPVVKIPGGYARRDPDGSPQRENDAIVPPDPVDLRFFQAIEKLQENSARLGYRQRLAASLRGNPDSVGVLAVLKQGSSYEPTMANAVDEQRARDALWLRYGEIQAYKDLIAEYERLQRQAAIDYEVEHLSRIARKLQSTRAALVGPVKALDAELKKEAQRLLEPGQVSRGALPPEQTQLWQVDQATIWGLVVIGSLLILGFCSRLAAIAGAVMLVMFYLPVPPWPGVPYPQEALGPEHSFIINKNLIEAIALVGIAALPTGSWFGADGLLRWLFRRGKST